MGARGQTLRLGAFIFLHFTPFSSYITIITQIFEEAGIPGIGPASLACIYIFFIVSTVLAPAAKWSLKNQFLFGACFYTLGYLSGIPASLTDIVPLKFAITCIGASLSGFSAGFLWVSQGCYVHLACERYGQMSRKGQMFGILNGLYCLSNVSAGLITTFGLGFFNALTYFYIISGLGIFAFLFCFFVVRDIQQMPPAQQSLISEAQLSPTPAADNPNNYNIWQSIKNTIGFTAKMYAVLIMMLMDGLATAIYSSEVTKLVPGDTAPDMVDKMAGITMISLGVGSVIGGFISGVIADKKGGLFAGRLGLVFWVLCCACFVSALQWESMWMAQVAGFMWGFAMFYLEGWLYTVISRNYGGVAEGFSVNKQFHSWFYLFFQVAVFATDNELPLKLLITFLGVASVPAVVMMNKIPHIRQNQLQAKHA